MLFVAEKRAAIDVVVDRLQRVGLDGLLMDAHGGIKSKREFAQLMADSMRGIGSIPEQDQSDMHGRLAELRRELLSHDEAMHQLRDRWNVTLYEVQGKIMGAPQEALAPEGMPPDRARRLDREAVDRLMRDVQEWVDLGGHRLNADYPEWARSSISRPVQAQEALRLVRELSTSVLPETSSRVFAALDEVGLAHPDTVNDWFDLLRWLRDVEEFLERRFTAEVYALDHDSLALALSPSGRWWEPVASMFSGGYRSARRRVEATLRTPSEMTGSDSLRAVELAAAQAGRWRELGAGDGPPRVPEGLGEALTAVTSLGESLRRAEGLFSPEDLLEKPHDELQSWLVRLASQEAVATVLSRVRELRGRLADAGFDNVISQVGNRVPPEHAATALEQSWLRAVWDDVAFNDPRVAGFTGALHSRRQEEFIELDHQHLEVTPARVRRAASEAAIGVMNAYPEETNLVKREAAKRSRHLPIRRLFQQAPHVLTAIRPCWAMSPLLVAELIPAGSDLFDVVIFDEASQIPPAEAIGVLARAPQAVIAGDDRQLPPTSFFSRHVPDDGDDEDDEGDTALTSDIESILDVAKASPIREELLQWHYRSRDGRLIAFSNANIYQGALTAFPGTTLEGPVTHHPVPFRSLPERSARSHPDEVERVLDMVIDHARRRPHRSLGVITFGIHHADSIDNALRLRLRELGDSSLDGFFSEEAGERFFVKNIERVQGDERDVIILSVGYHKAADGSLPYRFGPLNQEGGERRLNVAITRQRHEMHLVSSFSHQDMEPGRSSARGVELLRQYLEFAASGGAELGTAVSDVPLNGFELDVMHRLTDAGIPVTPQYGVGSYRLDFACGHPDQPGRMVLAIEADGASYHSGHTSRERDRLRQEILEAKGWRFHRIWSTSWFRDRDAEVARAMAAWRDACAALDGGGGSVGVGPGDGGMLEEAVPGLQPAKSGVKPLVMLGNDITAYGHQDLVALARWVMSDTLLRTDDELHREMRRELGFSRGGSRINPALQRAIDEARTSGNPGANR